MYIRAAVLRLPTRFMDNILNVSKQPISEILNEFETDSERGLSEEVISERLKKYGPNSIGAVQANTWFHDLLALFKNPLVLVLLVAGVISFSLGEHVNSIIIFLMVLLSVLVDLWQERDARNAAERLKDQVKTLSTVIRDGRQQTIAPETICPGDVLILNPGNIVPADARILLANDCFVNQSSLTGESFPSEKMDKSPDVDKPTLSDLKNMVFMGSSVISGTARVVVVQTGASTQFGHIASSLVRAPLETDFSRGVRDFGNLILKVTIGLVLFIFLVNSVLKHDFFQSFLFAVAVAVGLTPELLPMIMSVTMARGSVRMAAKGVIVKKLPAIPNFGSMEVLCTDKTGTLTEDKIQLVRHVDPAGLDSEPVFLWTYLNSLYQSGVDNPLDTAVLTHSNPDVSAYRKMDEIPFDFTRKRVSVLVQKDSKLTLICKGAPEELFRICDNDPAVILKAHQIYDELSADGYRVLAVAIRDFPSDKHSYTKADEINMALVGFAAFLDPPKPDAGRVIRELREIGVEVKIITGDNQLVTQKICKDIGLEVMEVMQGYELDGLEDPALQLRAVKTTIFARFSPEQKNRVIAALKPHYHSVGYMGDGINDAPSLRTADVGISVNNATDVAKDAAAIILTQKDLSVLKEGILEGRKTFANTMKYILMALSSNFGNMFSVAIAAVFLPFLPMLPNQILINNFLYDFSQIAIPYDSVDAAYTQKPQRWDMKLVRHFMWVYGLTSSVFDVLTFFLLYSVFKVSEAGFQTGWFMESLATQILVVFVIRTRKSPFWKSKPAGVLVLSTFACLGIGWFLPYSPLRNLIGFAVLPTAVTAWIIVLVTVYVFVAELVKRLIFKKLMHLK
jgi:Mg2+-importing ATPase